MNILVSACLLGLNCRYNGTGVLCKSLFEMKNKYNLIPVCPEIFGGLKTPRDPAEIKGNQVITAFGEDVTAQYKRGAAEALKLAEFYECELAILKERSPSCGCGIIHDGSFTGRLIAGNGITAELFLKNGIKIIGESEISNCF